MKVNLHEHIVHNFIFFIVFISYTQNCKAVKYVNINFNSILF